MLEKILEEIKVKAIELKNNHWGDDERHLIGKGVESMCVQAENIIRKHMNDGWILVEERFPEDNIDVLITYADLEDKEETGIAITTYGYASFGGNRLDLKEWRSPFRYFKANYKVIAWKPLPEPYRKE